MTATAQSALWQDTVTLTIRDLVRYAGASDDFNPIHYEHAFARSIGLPGIIAHGMFSMGIVARLVRQHASGAVRFDRISTRFAGVLLPDHEITITCYPGDDDPGPRSSSYRIDARHTGAANPSVICQVTVTPE